MRKRARELTVTKLERDADEGFWRANVTIPGCTPTPVHRQHGSWMVGDGEDTREVLPDVAEQLQLRVRRLEKAERRTGDETC